MIRNTFSILNGIGGKLEKRLWRGGVLTWDDFIGLSDIGFIRPEKKKLFDSTLAFAGRQLGKGNSGYFKRTMRGNEQWRLFDVFRADAVCLDIETNGLPPGRGGYVTMVGLYNGYDYECLIKGRTLTSGNLRNALSGYKYLITFFGSVFDMPFLKRTLGIDLDIPHFDLCFGARRLGMKGGLKSLEGAFGIARDEAVKGMDGFDAVLLWERARRGSAEALELLLKYNREDTVNLMSIADTLYEWLRDATGIGEFVKDRPSGCPVALEIGR
jgi:uncharacterized protein YprB with RNaseH-like and TPR domain